MTTACRVALIRSPDDIIAAVNVPVHFIDIPKEPK